MRHGTAISLRWVQLAVRNRTTHKVMQSEKGDVLFYVLRIHFFSYRIRRNAHDTRLHSELRNVE